MDLYEILELKPTASELDIKKAYLRLVKIYHPDRNKTKNAIDKFQKIQSAYEILINDNTRQEYQRMNTAEKNSFVEILEKIIKDKISLDELKNYGINLDKHDFEYLKNNFLSFFKTINVGELLQLFIKGVVPKKDFININNCSESEVDVFDETFAEYYYQLPISIQKVKELDIRIDLQIKLGDIAANNKMKIKIKRKLNENSDITTFVFNLANPYVVFLGAGDSHNGDSGNLIIKLNLPNNLFWNDNIILIEQVMTLYEMIYGLDIYLDLGENKNIYIQNWVPSRDGFIIDINNNNNNNNNNNKNIESNIKISSHNLAVKLYLNYEDSSEKEQILKHYFHNSI
jgi:curved DNA-binding protein CbpA